eukprot:TRINITY_DN33137_c0_g1_i1.p1 TRINITY_DN33137_c0_g1~~TRINITY_DN33137_c0_g1_i1.p1  ORF type:complete len:662 (-),score=161.65 TRINITY_DN33137_c0_g1_i1:14-1999(-)
MALGRGVPPRPSKAAASLPSLGVGRDGLEYFPSPSSSPAEKKLTGNRRPSPSLGSAERRRHRSNSRDVRKEGMRKSAITEPAAPVAPQGAFNKAGYPVPGALAVATSKAPQPRVSAASRSAAAAAAASASALAAQLDSDEDGDSPLESAGKRDALSATSRHLAAGGNAGARRNFVEGHRWVGGEAIDISSKLILKCGDGENGKIMDLNFHFKFLRSMDGLQDIAGDLLSLDLSSNNIKEIEGLKGMSKLRELKLYSCMISRIQGLNECPCLAALHLEDNRIAAIEGLETLRSLEYLNLERNKIQRLGKGLAKLGRLKELRISHNNIVSLEGLVSLTSLEVLAAGHNWLKSIESEHLKGFSKLDELHLPGNQLCSLEFLKPARGSAGMVNLATLDVSDNNLTSSSLRGLPAMPQLLELICADNRLETLPDRVIDSLQTIEILDLSRNCLDDLKEIEKLKSMPLKELMLEGNPAMTREPEQLSIAFKALESLEYVDDKPVEQFVLPALEDTERPLALEDLDTFNMTKTSGFGPGAASPARPGTGGSRPGTASGRPGTAGSRPGTAGGMKEAGIKDPLMHMRTKLNERKFATLEQATQWEQKTLSAFQAIEKQIDLTSQQAEDELRDMNRFLQKARSVLKREEQLKAAGLSSASDGTRTDDNPT